MKLNFKKGFTLIELLVVIAIIGILSGIVLSSLNSARTKGADAAVKGTMNSIRSQAELYYSNNGNAYHSVGLAGAAAAAAPLTTGACSTGMFADATVKNALNQLLTNGGNAINCALGTAVSNGTAQSYAVTATLKGGGAWCVDSSGNATSTPGAGGTPTAGTFTSAGGTGGVAASCY